MKGLLRNCIGMVLFCALFISPRQVAAQNDGYCTFVEAYVTRAGSGWRVNTLIETQTLATGSYQMYFNFHGDVTTKSVPNAQFSIPLPSQGVEYQFNINSGDFPIGSGVVQDRTATFFVSRVGDTTARYCTIDLNFPEDLEEDERVDGTIPTADMLRGRCVPGHINSAIGCIPFETPEATTAFFIRWALGVGGGISLFLIALSGMKIATTKGDPKRLQDAKDTLSSAIAGLVLIILSVYLVRFISEVLLSLF